MRRVQHGARRRRPAGDAGTVMPDGRAIEPKPILGIQRRDALLGARELGLGDDHSGILVLPEGTPLGLPYGEALGLRASGLRPRPHPQPPGLLGHLGVARELAARLASAARAVPPQSRDRVRRRAGVGRAHRRRSLRAGSPATVISGVASARHPTGSPHVLPRRACARSTTSSTSATT